MRGEYAWTSCMADECVCGAASVAALFAHVGIDLAGDVVLAHDAYGGLAHRSRSEVIAAALTLALGVLMLVVLALDEANAPRRDTATF